MTLHNSGSDKLKDASKDSKKLLDIVNTAPGPTPKEIEAFQQTLWNQAFLWSAPSEESGGQPAQQAFCTEQESHERWWSICYLFFDLIEYKSEREEAYIDHTAHSLFHPFCNRYGSQSTLFFIPKPSKSPSSVLFMSTKTLFNR